VKFERLRLAGFKTFVDPTEIVIAPGMTGVVGPNGCGKSNLVEALRWVMGETSSKSLRGGGMDDVIFAGSGNRPERNHAEVSIRIAEPPGDLPGHLAGAEAIDISRRIVREQGSTFRMNGREVRARDVQIFFADAASGARSPSMVRQGQIGEIIAAKPQHRRRILEDAAGVAGLHARRHEAELRLRAAEDNLTRADDVLGQIDRQIGDLRRQAKQAERYKAFQAEIRRLDLALLALSLETAQQEAEAVARAHDDAVRAIARATADQGETERARAVAEHELEALRARAGETANRLQGLKVAREALESELRLVEQRLSEIARRREELMRDRANADHLTREAMEAEARLEAESAALAAERDSAGQRRNACRAALVAAETARIAAEAAFAGAQARNAERIAERRSAESRKTEAGQRLARLEGAARQAAESLRDAETSSPELNRAAEMQARIAALGVELEAALAACDQAEALAREARITEQNGRPRLAEAERLLQRLETEARTIRKLVDAAEPGLWTRAIDRITAESGFETALAVALGDDLDAALEASAPQFWAGRAGTGPALPEGARPLLEVVQAPPALHLRLSQIGVVPRADGPVIQAKLAQGQRLVSREGDLWRWDGFTAKAEAPGPAARRLAERNRLTDLERDAAAARTRRDDAREAMDRAIRALKSAQEDEQRARDAARRLQLSRDAANTDLQREMRRTEEARLRFESLRLRAATLAADRDEAANLLAGADEALAALPDTSGDAADLAALSVALAGAREAEQREGRAKAVIDAEIGGAEARAQRIAEEIAAWRSRAERANRTLADHDQRMQRLDAEAVALDEQPARLQARRREISAEITEAESASRAASDALSAGETAFRKADEAARHAFQALAAQREQAARHEAERAHAAEKRASVIAAIEQAIDAPVTELASRIAATPPPEGMSAGEIERRLIDLKHERDRLGAVNLRADLELSALEGDKDRLIREREEFTAAIAKFRRAIDSLNSEGRARLRAAFETVNAHFKTLFERLFGGGAADLQLVEADDPLEAGLEIIAKPPGKKPQLLSLLSGGEQALTATALIFAVFRTNPSPICVLDEVDAPLDDSNVERLCDLLAEMARETSTRFLMITHNPISMARMDRLYGVTMVERGVSQLVSVDLAAAERLAEAS
jgi:chromosome segregation protein